MHEKKNTPNPLGVCQRLFDFMNNLIDRSLCKCVTLGPPVSEGRSTQLVEQKPDGSLRDKRKGAKESEEEEKIREKGKNIQSDQNLSSPKKDEDTKVSGGF